MVTSSIHLTFIPQWTRALRADWALVQGSWSCFLLWSEFYVEDSDTQLLASLGHILDSQHGGIWRVFITAFTFTPPITWQMGSVPERSQHGQV